MRSKQARRILGRACLVTAALLAVSYGARALGAPRLVIWELGQSMPRGIYVFEHFQPARIGEVVVLDDAPKWGRAYLMKRVQGNGGDLYCWDPARGHHTLSGRAMPPPAATAASRGAHTWTECRRLEEDEIVLYGDNLDSYDSRYFGPVRQAEVGGVYRLILPTEFSP